MMARMRAVTAAGSFRAMPGELLRLLTDRLPAPLEAQFRGLVALPEYRRAWIAVEQGFQDYVRSAFAELIARARRIDERTEQILEFQEQQLKRAEDEKVLTEPCFVAEQCECTPAEGGFRQSGPVSELPMLWKLG
jgi:hypothetical protein